MLQRIKNEEPTDEPTCRTSIWMTDERGRRSISRTVISMCVRVAAGERISKSSGVSLRAVSDQATTPARSGVVNAVRSGFSILMNGTCVAD
jgi:hypothetical protein